MPQEEHPVVEMARIIAFLLVLTAIFLAPFLIAIAIIDGAIYLFRLLG